MSGDATPNLDLVYLDASQAQPEVKINDAWNKIDGNGRRTGCCHGLPMRDSPFTSLSNVKTIRIAGVERRRANRNAVAGDDRC